MTDDLAQAQRHTLRVLAVGQVLGGLGVGSGIAVGGLIAEDVSGSTALSGLAQTSTVLGAAVTALPMARLMSVHGRRPGLVLGYLVALTGAILIVLGSVVEFFPLVLVGCILLGAGSATNLQSRYSAADLAPHERRARAIATIVWATTVGVVLGPNLTGPGGALARSLGLPELSGPLLFSLVAFAIAAVIIAVALRPDPLLLARRTRGLDPAAVEPPTPSFATTVQAVMASRSASLALVAVALAHTVMVSVMVMTPVHMRHEGATLRIVGIVISVHVAGMYAFSPIVGWLTDRLGRVPVIVLGQFVLVSAVAVAGGVSEDAHVGLGVGLLLLGLGWSCSLVAGSTLLSESVSDAVRPGVQGTSDFVMNGCGAIGGALAGVVVAGPGYGVLNALAGLLVCPVLALVLSVRRTSVRVS